MNYEGPERRANGSIEHRIDRLTELVHRLARLIEGENGAGHINRGIVGSVQDLTHTDAKLDKRLAELEAQWSRFKWTLAGAALGGGLAGGFAFDLIRHAIGAT